MLVVPCLVWAALIAIRFLLVSLALANLVHLSSAGDVAADLDNMFMLDLLLDHRVSNDLADNVP